MKPGSLHCLRSWKRRCMDLSATSSQDEYAAHALYNQMIGAMRKANSLSYVSHYTFEAKNIKMDCDYRVWLKKPNYFRVEAESALKKEDGITTWLKNFFRDETKPAPEKRGGILIGDGSTLWIYWLGTRPQFVLKEEESEADRKTHMTFLHEEARPAGWPLHRP